MSAKQKLWLSKCQQQAERAAAMRAQAQQRQQQALSQQRLTEIRIREVENDIARALQPADIEKAKRRMTEVLNQRQQNQQQLVDARLQQENAEIEAAKARLARERALEAQRLEAQAREDERKARALAVSASAGIPKGTKTFAYLQGDLGVLVQILVGYGVVS